MELNLAASRTGICHLNSILRKGRPGMRLNEYMEHPEGAVVFQHACKMG
jgi:hypothetical protein